MRSKLDFAVCGIGTDAISFLVDAIVEAGIGDGPFAWVGHVGEKWSLTLAQHGHINQWLACGGDGSVCYSLLTSTLGHVLTYRVGLSSIESALHAQMLLPSENLPSPHESAPGASMTSMHSIVKVSGLLRPT